MSGVKTQKIGKIIKSMITAVGMDSKFKKRPPKTCEQIISLLLRTVHISGHL